MDSSRNEIFSTLFLHKLLIICYFLLQNCVSFCKFRSEVNLIYFKYIFTIFFFLFISTKETRTEDAIGIRIPVDTHYRL